MFSHPGVARFIDERFESCWQSLRPVPVLRLDSGTGAERVRTLHGNIVTYVCRPDGSVKDIIPGLYDPEAYQRELVRAMSASSPSVERDAMAMYNLESSVRSGLPDGFFDAVESGGFLKSVPEDPAQGLLAKEAELNEEHRRGPARALLARIGVVTPEHRMDKQGISVDGSFPPVPPSKILENQPRVVRCWDGCPGRRPWGAGNRLGRGESWASAIPG